MEATEFAPVSRDGDGRLVLHRHRDVVAVAHDPRGFSSAVSRYLQIPNGLDGAEHAAFRRLLDPFFAPEPMAQLAPALQSLAADTVPDLGDGPFEAVGELGARYAVRAQSRWLGWRADLEDDLLAWVEDNRAAVRAADRSLMAQVAGRFDAIIGSLLHERRGPGAPNDLTTDLMRLPAPGGGSLTDEQLVSILRNWTGGDLSSLALCAGVVVHWLATHPEHQRELTAASDADLDAAIDEMLRLDDPFIANRRVAVAETAVGGCPIAGGEKLFLNWRTANVDPDVFADPHAFDPVGHADRNLVYGTGPHVCPGRPLATLELRVLVRALLAVGVIGLDPTRPAIREAPPVAGFHSVWVRLDPR